VGVALVYALGTAVWLVAGSALPGGRWFTVHLFTLGVVSNLILAFTRHFAETLLHKPAQDHPTARLVLFNAGAVGVLVGLPAGLPWLVAMGATLATAAVFWLYLTLRRLRRSALPSRFTFVVRTYERACGAFLHGALLGALLGTGVATGSWFAAVRLAHLHTNVLGWGGLTLLATVVLFGPTMLRTRMADGADAAAARWLRRGATGLTVGVLALIGSGAPGTAGQVSRWLAAAGLAVFAVTATVVCRSVATVAPRGRREMAGLSITAACIWFPLAAWADVVVVATARWWLLPVVGIALLGGVLAQAIAAALAYLAPMLGATLEPDRVRRRLSLLAPARSAVLNAGVGAAAVGVALHADVVVRCGWIAIVVVLVGQALLTAWPANRAPRSV
jgi:nitrite reductase (NO-forming)